ncbi:uncharacterized protein VTP21DRAFT_4003 [Calcarisporiella thermophila]|uniref:uncharacterized protein n=1 Tax=Calcarisporiella thermophila TaxID=911321 RepID=UPI003743023A
MNISRTSSPSLSLSGSKPPTPSSSPLPPLPSSAQTTLSRDYVTRLLSPRVAVVSSPDADAICQANNLANVVDLLTPFGSMIEGRVTARDSQGLPNPIENFTIRFAHLSRLEQPELHAAHKVLAEGVRVPLNPEVANKFRAIKTKEDVTPEYLETDVDELTPWYKEYKRLFANFGGISEHETFDHPVACIIAISSNNPEPMETLLQLYNITTPAPIFEKGFIDPNLLKYYVLIHDGHSTSLDDSQALFEKMKRTFGLHCHLLKLNSVPVDQSSNDFHSGSRGPDVWDKYMSERETLDMHLAQYASISDSRPNSISSPRASISTLNLTNVLDEIDETSQALPEEKQAEREFREHGQYISQEDFEGVKAMIREMVVQSIIPFMERNIQHWNDQIASSRRGFTGRLFGASRRLFGSGSKSPVPFQQSFQSSFGSTPSSPSLSAQDSNNNQIYPHSSPEAQLRKLADFAFMLRDYRLAHSVYEAVKRDFQADKAWKYHAGTQEMMGICLLLMPNLVGSKTDVDHYFSQAVSTYSTRCRAPYFATRATLFYYELLKFRKMYREAPSALVRMTGEDSDLRSGLLLEQAAHCFLRTQRPMVRKYAFHLILAGHRYGKCNQREHAYRCYLAASYVYDAHQWSLIEDHVHATLGRQAFHLKDLDGAIGFFLKLLRESRQPAHNQAAYLKEFLFIYKHWLASFNGKAAVSKLPDIPIPVVNRGSVKVTLSNTSTTKDDEDEETWAKLEKDLADISEQNRNKDVDQAHNRTICAVGEPVLIHIELYNPMQVQLTLSDIILGCTHQATPRVPDTEALEVVPDYPEGQVTENDGEWTMACEDYLLEQIKELILEPLEHRVIKLKVTPRKEGSVHILGMHFLLQGAIPGFRHFYKRGKRLNDTKQQRMGVVYMPDHSLNLLVTSPMPLLNVTLHSFPDVLLSGEVTQAILEINNRGERGLTCLRLGLSHPGFLCVEEAGLLDQTIYEDSLEKKEESMNLENQLFNPRVIDIFLPQDETGRKTLAPGATTLVPMWVRGDRIGKYVFRFLFSYQSEEKSAIRYRTVRLSATLQVLPSLRINAFTRPSTRGHNEFVLGIEMENLQTMAEFQFMQLSLSSPTWRVAPLTQPTDETVLIGPRQTHYSYYSIQREKVDVDHSPERFTSDALEKFLLNDRRNLSKPPPIQINTSHVTFSSNALTNTASPLRNFLINSRVHWRNSTLSSQYALIPERALPSLFTLYTTHDVDLTLYWQIPSMKRRGHHHIIGINLGAQQNPFQGKINARRALYEQAAREQAALVQSIVQHRAGREESPLRVHIRCPNECRHNFDSGKPCIMPVEVKIVNFSWNRSVQFTIQMESDDGRARNSGNPASRPSINILPFSWVGMLREQGQLTPGQTCTLMAHACFLQAGVYDVNQWRLGVLLMDGEEEKTEFFQSPTLPHIVTVS